MNGALVDLVERHHGDRDAALEELLAEYDRLREALVDLHDAVEAYLNDAIGIIELEDSRLNAGKALDLGPGSEGE